MITDTLINSILMHYCNVVKLVKYATSYSREHICAWAEEFSSTCFNCHLFILSLSCSDVYHSFTTHNQETRTHTYTLIFSNIAVSGSMFINSHVLCICCRWMKYGDVYSMSQKATQFKCRYMLYATKFWVYHLWNLSIHVYVIFLFKSLRNTSSKW